MTTSTKQTETTKHDDAVRTLTERRDLTYTEAVLSIIEHMGPHDCEVDYDGILIECFDTDGEGKWWLKETFEALEQAEGDYAEGGAKYDTHLAHLYDDEKEERLAAAFGDGPTGHKDPDDGHGLDNQIEIGEYFKLAVTYYDEEKSIDGFLVRALRTRTREYVFPDVKSAMAKVAECKAKDGIEEVTMASTANDRSKFSVWTRHYLPFHLSRVTEFAVI